MTDIDEEHYVIELSPMSAIFLPIFKRRRIHKLRRNYFGQAVK